MRAVRSRNLGLRTVDVARRAGCSVQQVRNLEHEGVLPPATRGGTGYRTYTDVHVQSALAYRALASGVGPTEAKTIMRAGQRPALADCLALIDAAHARLHRERREVEAARLAVAAISVEPIDDVRSADAMTISELAGAIDVRTSALRHWEAEGLIVPGRSRDGGARTYTPADVRDARIVHQLRQAGYRIATLRDLMPQLRQGRRHDDIAAVLLARQQSVTTRSHALLRGSAALEAVLDSTASSRP